MADAAPALDGFGTLRPRDLSIIGFGQGFTLWHYKALHLPMWRLTLPGFFDPVGENDRMRVGDMILASASDGGATLYVGAGSQGARFTLTPVNSIFTETACPTPPTLPPPGQSRLAALLRRLVNATCWSR